MDPGQLHIVEIVALLRKLTAQLIACNDLEYALGRVADCAVELVDGPAWCGVTMVRTGGWATAAASAGFPDGLDPVQDAAATIDTDDAGDGPGMTAIRTRDMVICQDLRTEVRWPQWSSRARERGVHGVLSIPVDFDDQVIGSLNLYVGAPEALTSDVQLVAMLVAEHAGLLIAAVLDRTRQASQHDDLAATLADALTDALTDGGPINRAIGIIMAQRACSADDALNVLRQAAGTLRQPLSAVAERLVSTVTNRSGSGPADPGPADPGPAQPFGSGPADPGPVQPFGSAPADPGPAQPFGSGPACTE